MNIADSNHHIFNEAVNKFFAHNPANPWLTLIALYLRKKHQIEISLSTDVDPADVIAAVSDKETIVGNLFSDARLQQIFHTFEEESGKGKNSRESGSYSDRFRLEPKFLLDFVSSLLKIDDTWLEENFNSLFDQLVQRCFLGGRLDIHSQPKELTQLIKHLIGNNVEKVYDPFAGVASLALAIPENAKYIGEEIEPLVAAIGNLRVLANDIDGVVLTESSVNDESYDADIIVSTPPFYLSVNPKEFPGGEKYGKRNDAYTFLFKKCLFERRRAIIAAVSGFGMLNSSRECREMLVKADFIDTVLSLPSNIFDMTGSKMNLFVLNPDRERPGKVRFIDASEQYYTLGRKHIIKVDEVISLLNSADGHCVDVTLDEIEENNYILAPELYLEPQIQVPEGASLVKFSDLVTRVFPKRIRERNGEREGEILNIGDAGNLNHMKIYRPGKDFKMEKLPPMVNVIKRSCILVRGIMGKYKGILVEPEGKTLYAPASWRQFVIKDEDVTLPQYLILQLFEPYLQRQLASGVFITDYLLMNAKVIIPPVERQKQEIDAYKENFIAELGIKIERDRRSKENDFEEEMRVRRHALLNKLHNSIIGMQLLDGFVNSSDGVFHKDSEVVEGMDLTLGKIVSQLHSDMRRLVDMADKLADVESFGQPEVINISDFCNEYERINKDFPGCSLMWPNNKDVSEGRANREELNVSFSKHDLTLVFENIIFNAMRHGFGIRDMNAAELKDGHSVGTVRIEFEHVMSEDNVPVAVIRFLNNGKPLPSNMSCQAVFEWGKGGGDNVGSGIGGWHIKRIMEHFGGTAAVRNLENDERGFNVEYELVIPLLEKN